MATNRTTAKRTASRGGSAAGTAARPARGSARGAALAAVTATEIDIDIDSDIGIGIGRDARAAIADGLSALLADSYTLYLMTHNFHWNVTGPQFNSLHAMFMAQYTEQWNALDVIAERIRALGHPAPGTYREFVQRASIREVEGVPAADAMVRLLVAAQEATARTARRLFPVVNEANDQPTADLLTQRLEVHEKTAWMLRSLLEV